FLTKRGNQLEGRMPRGAIESRPARGPAFADDAVEIVLKALTARRGTDRTHGRRSWRRLTRGRGIARSRCALLVLDEPARRQGPGEMLAAVEGDHLAGDRRRRQEEEDRFADLFRRRAAAEGHGP